MWQAALWTTAATASRVCDMREGPAAHSPLHIGAHASWRPRWRGRMRFDFGRRGLGLVCRGALGPRGRVDTGDCSSREIAQVDCHLSDWTRIRIQCLTGFAELAQNSARLMPTRPNATTRHWLTRLPPGACKPRWAPEPGPGSDSRPLKGCLHVGGTHKACSHSRYFMAPSKTGREARMSAAGTAAPRLPRPHPARPRP